MSSCSLSCLRCRVCWPADPAYDRCPDCETRTWPMPDPSIPENEARKRKAHAEFERFYANREAPHAERLADELIASATEPAASDPDRVYG